MVGSLGAGGAAFSPVVPWPRVLQDKFGVAFGGGCISILYFIPGLKEGTSGGLRLQNEAHAFNSSVDASQHLSKEVSLWVSGVRPDTGQKTPDMVIVELAGSDSALDSDSKTTAATLQLVNSLKQYQLHLHKMNAPPKGLHHHSQRNLALLYFDTFYKAPTAEV